MVTPLICEHAMLLDFKLCSNHQISLQLNTTNTVTVSYFVRPLDKNWRNSGIIHGFISARGNNHGSVHNV